MFAPSRCALETMSSGIPAIGVGSKSYCGLVQPEPWRLSVYSNCGGVGNQHKDYTPKMVHWDIDKLLGSSDYSSSLGEFGSEITQQFFDARQVHEQLLGIYRIAIKSHFMSKGVVSTAAFKIANTSVKFKKQEG